jgi:glutamine---fructose-6-phosphate transaminase (isomerizing)
MDYYEALAAQPARLVQSATAVRATLAKLDLAPWRDGTLAVVSMGASHHAGHAFAHRLARNGRRVVNVTASALLDTGRRDLADSYLFVSESGRSPETIKAAQLVDGPRIALTNKPEAPLAQVVESVVGLDHGEDSEVYTIGYTATLQAFGLLAEALEKVDAFDDWPELPGRLATLLSAEPVDLNGLTSIDVVGSASAYASAAEAALVLRESCRITTATYETYQYLHGPMEPLEPSSGCLIFGDDREVSLAGYLAGAGVPTVLVTAVDVAGDERLRVVRVPDVPAMSRAVLEIVPVQVAAGALARVRGLGIDGFRYHQDDTKVDGVSVAPTRSSELSIGRAHSGDVRPSSTMLSEKQ